MSQRLLVWLIVVPATLLIGAFVVWVLTSLASWRARKIQRASPGSWVRPVSFGYRRGMYLLSLSVDRIALLGLTGRVVKEHPRSELAHAEIGKIRFPAASRVALSLAFTDSDNWKLLARGGLGSSRPFSEEAIAFLRDHGQGRSS